jgi:hypothetical protein
VLGTGTSSSGDQTLNVKLPQVWGTGFYIRVVSKKNAALLAQSPALTIPKPNAVDGRDWSGYQ